MTFCVYLIRDEILQWAKHFAVNECVRLTSLTDKNLMPFAS